MQWYKVQRRVDVRIRFLAWVSVLQCAFDAPWIECSSTDYPCQPTIVTQPSFHPQTTFHPPLYIISPIFCITIPHSSDPIRFRELNASRATINVFFPDDKLSQAFASSTLSLNVCWSLVRGFGNESQEMKRAWTSRWQTLNAYNLLRSFRLFCPLSKHLLFDCTKIWKRIERNKTRETSR